MRIGFISLVAFILCACTPKVTESTIESTPSSKEAVQVAPQEPASDLSKVKLSVALGNSYSDRDRQFLESLVAKDIEVVRQLSEEGFDLWHRVDFDETDAFGNTRVSQYPIVFAVLTGNDPDFIGNVLSIAASKRDLSIDDYGSAPGESAAFRVAVNDRLFPAIGPILKTWPWQLTASWDDGGSLPERPTIYFATMANDQEMVELLLKEGFPGNFEFKRGGRGFPILLTDETENAEIRSILVSYGARDFVTFDRKNWILELADKTELLESKDQTSKVLSFLEKGEKIELIGRTTGPPNRLIQILTADGRKGFVSEGKIEFDWGM